MQGEIAVSIVIPCYNDGQYVQQAVTSCLQQTFPGLEVLIVDDGSDDPLTQQTLKEIHDDRVRLIHANHVGPAQARNMAIEKAHGRYILPLDADDWIEKDYVAAAVSVMENRPEIGIVYCRATLFGEKEGQWKLPDYSLQSFLIDNCIFITAMFRKAEWLAVGGFCTGFQHGLEDYDFWLSIIERGYEVYQFPLAWFHYRIKSESRSSSLNGSLEKTIETYALLYQRHHEFFAQHMDMYCLGLRKALLEQKALSSANDAVVDDPVSDYWQTIKQLKPKRAKQIEKMLALKNRIKGGLRWSSQR